MGYCFSMSGFEIQKSSYGYYSIHPLPTEEELERHYQNTYFQMCTALNYQTKYTDEELEYITNENERMLFAIEQFKDLSDSKILEIGVGEGYLLRLLRSMSSNARGIDYSSFGVTSHNPELEEYVSFGNAIEFLQGYVTDRKVFDVIIAKHIYEHVIDPVELTSLCRAIMSPGGLLVVQVPNDFNRVQNLALEGGFIEERFWITPPEHLHYFSRDSLSKILESNGFKVCDVFADFPIDWFLLNQNSNYVSDRARGKDAHRARVMIDKLITESGSSNALNFYRAMATVDLGRDLCVVARKQY